MTRRELLLSSVCLAPALAADKATNFQLACMTLPYSQFPMARALEGIRAAGYRFVAWGTVHQESPGERKPVIALDAPPSEAKRLAERCRNMGLTPVMLFANVQLEAPDALAAHLKRIDQAAAAGIRFLLTFGKTVSGQYDLFIRNLKEMAPVARRNGVTVVIKQHGGNTATGQGCARIVEEVGDEGLKICYDAGNVMDYERLDPLPDIQTCWRHIRAFAIKDHRWTPKNEDCGPGLGAIDHYKLLEPVRQTGLDMPLACENIFEPGVPRPTDPDKVDALARRARLYLEKVVNKS